MLRNKRSQIPMVMTIVILLTFTIILISTMLILLNMKNISIDDRKINSQIAIKKIINSNCFSNEYGTIEIDKYNENTLNNCFKGEDNILLIMGLENKNELFLNSKKEEISDKIKLCSSKSSQLCSELKYPILIKSENTYESSLLRVIIIAK